MKGYSRFSLLYCLEKKKHQHIQTTMKYNRNKQCTFIIVCYNENVILNPAPHTDPSALYRIQNYLRASRSLRRVECRDVGPWIRVPDHHARSARVRGSAVPRDVLVLRVRRGRHWVRGLRVRRVWDGRRHINLACGGYGNKWVLTYEIVSS